MTLEGSCSNFQLLYAVNRNATSLFDLQLLIELFLCGSCLGAAWTIQYTPTVCTVVLRDCSATSTHPHLTITFIEFNPILGLLPDSDQVKVLKTTTRSKWPTFLPTWKQLVQL